LSVNSAELSEIIIWVSLSFWKKKKEKRKEREKETQLVMIKGETF
jgi:hypothetical protein